MSATLRRSIFEGSAGRSALVSRTSVVADLYPPLDLGTALIAVHRNSSQNCALLGKASFRRTDTLIKPNR